MTRHSGTHNNPNSRRRRGDRDQTRLPVDLTRLSEVLHFFDFAVIAAFIALSASATFAQTPNSPAEAIASGGGFVGRAGCAASTCHGGVIGRGPAWRYSLTRWVAEDPHAEAGLVLRNSLSESIVIALDPTIAELKNQQATKTSDQQTWTTKRDALLRRRCLSCHVTATPQQCRSTEPLSDITLATGVSCESCHGAAEPWLQEHLQFDFEGPQRWETGMRDTESILGRSDGCVRCHVGSRTEDGLVRDMNHDLIAAGHPVLRFDLSLFDAALPQHWDHSSSPRFYESPVRVRQVSRASSLAAAARLAGERADGYLAEQQAELSASERIVPLPELSDYDCFACHQTLSMDQYLLPIGANQSDLKVSAGMPNWNSWYTTSQLTLNDEALKILKPQSIDTAKAKLLSSSTANLAKRYHGIAADLQAKDYDALTEINEVVSRMKPSDDWHKAAVDYLDLEAALRQLAGRDAKYQPFHDKLISQVQPLLQFGNGWQSPADFGLNVSERFRSTVEKLLQPIIE